jgi:hypothetical protein
VLQVDRALYRSFRVRTLYEGVTDDVDDGGGSPRPGGHTGDGLRVAVPAAQPASPAGLQEVSGVESAVAGRTSIVPNTTPIARTAPLAAPPLFDWLFASPTREELGGAALEGPLVNGGAQRPVPWQLLLSDLDLPKHALLTLPRQGA